MAVDEGAGGGGGGHLMWISVFKSSSSSSGYGGGTRMAGRSSQVIPPPGPPTRPGAFVFRPSPVAAYTAAAPVSAAAAVTVMSAAQLPSAISRLPASTATAECLTGRDGKTVAIPGLPVTPPSKFKRLKIFMKMTRKERRKKSDQRGCDEGSCHDSVMADCRRTQRSEHQLNERGRVSHREDPPGRCSWGNYNNSPVNYSYGTTGVDHLRQQNFLPLWLEDRRAGAPQSSVYTSRGREVAATDNDGSFETRWDSFRGKNKVHSSSWVGQRPPGWEDVGPSNVTNNTRQYTSNYCPTFGVQNIGSSGTENTLAASAPPYDLIATSPWSEDSGTQHYVSGDNIEQLQSSMGNNENFSESFVEDQSRNTTYNPNNSESYAEIQQEIVSASKRRSEPCTAEEDATSYIADKHLWASSDSFYCEDFTYFDKKRKYEHNDISVQPRSYSEVQLQKNYSETSLEHPSSSNTNDEEPIDTHRNSRVTDHSSDTQSYTSDEESVPDTPPLDRLSLNESFQDSPTSGHTVNNNSDGSRPQSYLNLESDTTLPVEHTAHRGNWVQFDRNSIDSLKWNTQAAQGASMRVFLPMNNKSRDSRGTKDPQVSGALSAVSPQTDNHEKPVFGSKEACGGQPSGNYSGRLIRTYSQRGRRMSKRMINSFSRKMSSSDYGKVPEPTAPMYSKAVLTMTSGPGLFEQTITEDSDTDQTESIRIEEPPKVEDAVIESNVKETPPPTTSGLFLQPARPARVGSLRVPRLSAALVRRSVSLNAPKVERDEVPFQRLPDRRPGSFRKAISGLGALARSFRKKSNSSEREAAAPVTETNKKTPIIVPSQGLHCTGSVGGGGSNKQTPRAPQLPRRAITHRTVASDTPQLHSQV